MRTVIWKRNCDICNKVAQSTNSADGDGLANEFLGWVTVKTIKENFDLCSDECLAKWIPKYDFVAFSATRH